MKKFRGVQKIKKSFIWKGPNAQIQLADYIIKFKKCRYIRYDVDNSHKENRNTKEYLR